MTQDNDDDDDVDDDNDDDDDDNDDDDVDDDDYDGHHDSIVVDLTQDNDDDDHNKWQCSICINAILPDSMQYLPCAHGFHNDCITKWLQIKKYCPICKHNVDW